MSGKRRKNAGLGYGYQFHGAFSEKKDAVKKEKQRKGSFIKGVPTQHGYRYLVMSPRTNPRKRSNPAERAWKAFTAAEQRELKRLGFKKSGFKTDADVQSAKAALAQMEATRHGGETHGEMLKRRLGDVGAYASRSYSSRSNPSIEQVGPKSFRVDNGHGTVLLLKPTSWGGWEVQADNARARVAWRGPGTHVFHTLAEVERKYKAFRGISKAMEGHNPSELLVMAANPHDITVPAGTTITIRTNPERANSLGSFLGFAPKKPTKKELAESRRSFKAGVRAKTAEESETAKSLRRAARSSQKHDRTARVFHEVYGQQTYDAQGLPSNPAAICGASVGGYPCTRKPGHRGPHLPQGATMRTRKRLPHNWQPRAKNPSAEALREKFTGTGVERVRIYDEPHMPAGDYAMLGKLLALYVKPRHGGQVQMIQPTGAITVSDESARQIYFVGGDQDVSAGLHVFGAVDRGAGLFELGEARRIDYKQRKEHVPHPESDSWRHEFGEESGVRPIVLFDANAKRLLLEGGEYEIRAEGIVN